jgi:hypothetical protein
VPGDLRGAGAAATPERTAANGAPSVRDLLRRMLEAGDSFWSTVYEPFMNRDLLREDLKTILAEGLERTGGSYRLLVRLFNMPDTDYRRFLNFLRKHGCHLPYRAFRLDAGSVLKTSLSVLDQGRSAVRA